MHRLQVLLLRAMAGLEVLDVQGVLPVIGVQTLKFLGRLAMVLTRSLGDQQICSVVRSQFGTLVLLVVALDGLLVYVGDRGEK